MGNKYCYQYITITDYDLMRWKGLEGEQLIEQKKNSFPAWVSEKATPVYSKDTLQYLSNENRKLYNEELHDLAALIERVPYSSFIYISNINDISDNLETTARILKRALEKQVEVRYDEYVHVNGYPTVRVLADLAEGFEQYYGVALEERNEGFSNVLTDTYINELLLSLEKLPKYKELGEKLREKAILKQSPEENLRILINIINLIDNGMLQLANPEVIRAKIETMVNTIVGKPIVKTPPQTRGRKEDPILKDKIRSRFMKGEKQVDIARKLNVSTSMVSRAVKDLKK